MFELRFTTPAAWTEIVLSQFDRFLQDHAACERKASATGLSIVVHYPDRTALLEPMIEFAREELEHFHQVVVLLNRRGVKMPADEKDPYVTALLQHLRSAGDDRLLDRLILSAIIEARGCERFGLLADALEPGELKDFYVDITGSEARHRGLFLRLARLFFDDSTIDSRLNYLLVQEAAIIQELPLRPALH